MLRRLRGERSRERLEIKRAFAVGDAGAPKWRIDCTTCSALITGNVDDDGLVRAIFHAAATHYCRHERELQLIPEQLR